MAKIEMNISEYEILKENKKLLMKVVKVIKHKLLIILLITVIFSSCIGVETSNFV